MKIKAENILHHHIQLWSLIYDGESFYTHSSLIQPVIWDGIKSMLKIPFTTEEKRGSKVLDWWNGIGAAKVFRLDDDAVLMERIAGNQSLKSMSLNNQDNETTKIICDAAKVLHSCKNNSLPELTPLNIWFEELFESAEKFGDIFMKSANVAKLLLSEQNDRVVLHGDLHHDNILYSSTRGWVAIDPKGLFGEKAFDYVNILCNPTQEIALAEGRMMRQVEIISKNTGIAIKHLLEWTVAWAGLSAVWFLNDGMDADIPVEILKLAISELSL